MKINITLIAALGTLFFWFISGFIDSIPNTPPSPLVEIIAP
jgi:hypothetical protein